MHRLNTSSLKQTYKEVKEKSIPDFDYYSMLILSSIICFFGFKMNNVAVIVGAMVISPLLYSIVGIATSIFFLDMKQLIKELLSLILEITLVILIIFLFGKVFDIEISTEITSRLDSSNLDYFLVAFFSGIAGSLSIFWPKIEQALVGVAISVALIPPIVLCGIGLALGDIGMFTDSINIVSINLLGIILGSFLLLLILKFKKEE